MEITLGMTAGPIRGTGLIIICMDKASTSGPMEGNTRESTSMIKSMGTAPTFIPMAGPIADNGHLVNNTEKEFSSLLKELREKESGKRERESTG